MTLPRDLKRWPTECLAAWDHYVERAAFRQFCGNQSREEAEREAEAEARRIYGHRNLERKRPGVSPGPPR